MLVPVYGFVERIFLALLRKTGVPELDFRQNCVSEMLFWRHSLEQCHHYTYQKCVNTFNYIGLVCIMM